MAILSTRALTLHHSLTELCTVPLFFPVIKYEARHLLVVQTLAKHLGNRHIERFLYLLLQKQIVGLKFKPLAAWMGIKFGTNGVSFTFAGKTPGGR